MGSLVRLHIFDLDLALELIFWPCFIFGLLVGGLKFFHTFASVNQNDFPMINFSDPLQVIMFSGFAYAFIAAAKFAYDNWGNINNDSDE